MADGSNRNWEWSFSVLSTDDIKIKTVTDDGVEEDVSNSYKLDTINKIVIYPTEESELAPLAKGTKVVLYRQTPITQDIDLIRQGNLDAETLECGYDKRTLVEQELAEKLDRAIKFPLGDVRSTNAAEYLDTVTTSAKNALESANAAKLSEGNAKNSEVLANMSAEFATQKAEQAVLAAETATLSANAALESEASAKISEENVAESESAAKESEIIAREKASLAYESAESALNSADKAENAQLIAESAAIRAEKAAEAVKRVMEYKGSVATFEDLPFDSQIGDVWNVSDTGANYSWDGEKWDKFSEIVDLTEYVKKTDYATTTKAGLVKPTSYFGTNVDSSGAIHVTPYTVEQLKAKSEYTFISKGTLDNIKNDYVKRGLTENDIELTEEEKSAAKSWLGIEEEGGSAEIPDNVYTEENFIAGENVTFNKKSGTDDNTVALFHFDGDTKDAVSGNELSESPVIATESKFGTGSLKTRENWFNSVSFAKSIDPKTTSFTLEFWHKQVAGSVMGAYGDETTIVLAPTAPNNTASKSQWVGLYMLPDGSNNKISLQIGDSRLGQFYTTNYTTLGEWNHYALTWDASTHYFKLYMNGTYVDQYQYYYYDSLPILGGIGMFKYTDGNDGDTKAQMYIDELRFSDNVRYTGSFEVATEAFPSDKLKTIVNVNIPESVFNKDNLLGGKKIEIIPEPVGGGIDEHTVACWHFDGNKKDEVNGLDFYTSDGTYVTGKFGQALTKNSNNYTVSTKGLVADKITASGDYTVDFWLFYNQLSTSEGFVDIGENGYWGVRLGINSQTGKVSIKIQSTEKASATYTFAVTTWYHLVLQKKGNIIFVFINGVKVLEYDATDEVGLFTGAGVSFKIFLVVLDEVRISDVARYDGDFTPPTKAYRLEVPTGRFLVNFTGQSGKNIGEVYYSQSSLATDNAGALPLFTGETIASADTIYPDFYNWVTEHTELQATAEEYETAITNYGECPKYVLSSKVITWTTGTYTIYSRQYPRYVSEFFSDKDCTKQLTPSDIGLSSYEEDGLKIIEKDGNTVTALGNSSIINENVTFLPDVDFTGTGDTSSYQRYFTKASEEDYLSGSLRLPKKSLSHGIVVKEKKPTDLDPTWYRQWSDGWLEQGGVTGAVTGGQSITTTLLKEYANENYTVIAQGLGTYTASGEANCPITLKNTTSFSLTSGFNGSKTFNWYACGQGADGAQDETLYPWVFAYNATVPASTAQAAAFQESVSSLNEFKANKDLANVDKSLLISYGTPDFTARIDNSANTEYTAERAGILIGKLGAGGNYGSAVLTIDGLDFPLQSNGETWGSYQFPFCIPVGQGSVYKLTASCYVSAFYFIPLKGAL